MRDTKIIFARKNYFPDCNYQIIYSLNNKEQTTKINSEKNSIQFLQGEQVEVYYKKTILDNRLSESAI
jgi:hypothetical protein